MRAAANSTVADEAHDHVEPLGDREWESRRIRVVPNMVEARKKQFEKETTRK